MNVSKFDLAAAGVAAVLVTVLALFFNRTRIGRALRAVADDHQAALAVGIPLQQIWAIVWGVAGAVALVAGHAVGRAQRRAVRADVRRAEGAAGADPRRLRLGAGRHRRRTHHRRVGEARRGLSRPVRRRRHRGLVPVRAGARRSCWCGPKACSARRSSAASDPAPPTCSIAKPDSSRRPTRRTQRSSRSARTASRSRRSLLVAFVVVPLVATPYVFTGILIPFLILSLAALGLNILTGYAGQLSLGTAAFMAVGAFASYNFMLRVPGMPILVAFAGGGVVAALVGHPCSACRACASAASTSRWPRSPRSSSSCGS